MSYICDQHPDHQGSALLTNLANGDTIVMCPDCLPAVLRGVADLADPQAAESAMASEAPADVEGSPNAEPDATEQPVPYALTDQDLAPEPDEGRTQPGGVNLTDQHDAPLSAS